MAMSKKRRPSSKSIISEICVLAAGLSVTACVELNKTLLADPKTLLGQHFDMVEWRDFEAGKGFGSQHMSYRWWDGAYLRDSATTTHVIRFEAEPLNGTDFIIERSRSDRAAAPSNLFTY